MTMFYVDPYRSQEHRIVCSETFGDEMIVKRAMARMWPFFIFAVLHCTVYHSVSRQVVRLALGSVFVKNVGVIVIYNKPGAGKVILKAESVR